MLMRQPQVLRIETEFIENNDDSILEKILNRWAHIPYWILQGFSNVKNSEKLKGFIKKIYQRIIGKIYLEASSKEIGPDMLKSLYLSGTGVLVMLVDLHEKSSDELIESLVSVRDSMPGHSFLLKIQNNTDDPDEIPLLIRKWQYIVDGIVITPDHKNVAYQAKLQNTRCTKVPFEAYINKHGKLSICTRIDENALSPDDLPGWHDRSLEAGKFAVCENCPEKSSYVSGQGFILKMAGIEPYIYEQRFKKKILYIDKHINENNFSGALDAIENILKSDPSNPLIWNKIKQLEKKLDV